jgi:hypothetical protein
VGVVNIECLRVTNELDKNIEIHELWRVIQKRKTRL